MDQPNVVLKKTLLNNALSWFQPHLREKLIFPIESQFPNYALPSTIQLVLRHVEEIVGILSQQTEPVHLAKLLDALGKDDLSRLPLFKQIIVSYRRYRAAETERLAEKTFHLELAGKLEEDVKALDSLVANELFQQISVHRLPPLKEFLPVQYIESTPLNQVPLLPRQYDEKFHILQAPNLFLPDLAYFRAKCADREMPLAVAFLDIDGFKQFNTDYGETKIDRNLLPRFMQTLEAHVFHHGYAYRQGGDEYLILVPSLSKQLAIAFLDELRSKVGEG